MTTTCRSLGLLLLTLCFSACTENQADAVPVDRLVLPASLLEVSGLAVADDGLYAVADELGQIFRIQFDQAKVEATIGFGDPIVKADFEGLTIAGETLYGLTSKGVIYQRGMESGAETLKIKTGLSKRCEFEGLAADPLEPILWLLCKTPLAKDLKKRLTIYAWHRDEQRELEELSINVKYKTLGLNKNLAPSGLNISPDGQTMLLIAAKQQAYAYITRAGDLISAGNLPNRRHHPQAEGVIAVGKAIYVADEGVGGPATITRYRDGF